MDFKDIIADKISNVVNINKDEIKSFIEVPKEDGNGDFSFPCFRLAKELKKAPQIIAEDIKNAILSNNDEMFEKIDSVNGFLNFYISKSEIVKETADKFNMQKENYGQSNMGNGKKIVVEFSSPNIAKPFHIGHLKNTIIGNSIYNIYKFLGFDTFSINHLGDYGTQFAKLIEGYKRWGNEYDFSVNPIDKMADMYARINKLCDEDENVLNECRDTFKKLEDGDKYCTDLWNNFKDLSLKEFNKIYDLLGVKFDSWNGESFYSDKMQEVIDILEKSGKLTDSQGAKIVDLEDMGINTPCIIQKSNGSSIYATRDLAAILYRSRTYDFDKCLYVVAVEQSLHFKQIFAVAKYLGIKEKCLNGLEHISYGMIRLPEGKMSTRKGNFVKVEDLLNEAMSKVREIMESKNVDGDIDTIAKQVGIGAVVFDDLSENRIKDQVFDLNKALNFNGETGPYVQYMAVRTKSVLEKAMNNGKENANYDVKENIENIKNSIDSINENIDFNALTDDASLKVIKLISNFQDTIINAMEKNEPSIISRYLINLAKAYSAFYAADKIICDDKNIQDARVYLTYMTNVTLTNGLKLLGIEVPDKM